MTDTIDHKILDLAVDHRIEIKDMMDKEDPEVEIISRETIQVALNAVITNLQINKERIEWTDLEDLLIRIVLEDRVEMVHLAVLVEDIKIDEIVTKETGHREEMARLGEMDRLEEINFETDRQEEINFEMDHLEEVDRQEEINFETDHQVGINIEMDHLEEMDLQAETCSEDLLKKLDLTDSPQLVLAGRQGKCHPEKLQILTALDLIEKNVIEVRIDEVCPVKL